MGFAIADELALRGAEVFLVTGPVTLNTFHPEIKRTDVVSATEMNKVCRELFPDCDAAVFAAAVSDYAPADILPGKIKRTSDDLTIRLKANPDIAAGMGAIKTKDQVTIGFALETSNEEINAIKKIEDKNFDFIVLNSPNKEMGEGFMTDTNRITIIYKDHKKDSFPLKSKKRVAGDIVSALEKILL
jgi:phosphopantothenoylcysteine decarboxylase/phosphopantothenate--cysteine ligase